MKLSRGLAILLATSLGWSGCIGQGEDPIPAGASAQITPDLFGGHVKFLADPALGGRVAGTHGNRTAAEYIAEQFRQTGLSPAGESGTFFQPFTNDRLRVAGEGCVLAFEPPRGAAPGTGETGAAIPAIAATLGRDFAPSAQGRVGAFRGPLIFAGYGLHNHVRDYDDYGALSVRGAVVMILAGEPHDPSGQSRWALQGDETHLGELPYKLRLARERGAVAALVVTPPALLPRDNIDDVLGDGTGALPAVRITRDFANRILAAAGERRSVEQLADQINRTARPLSLALGGSLSGQVAMEMGRCRNILGVLPPDGADDGSVIVIGAHYDHIPATGQLAKDVGPGIRPGADDNASGDSTVMMLARALAATPGRHCTYLFAAFDSEEIGFAGSRYYVQHPALSLDRAAVMINIDQDGYVGWAGVMLMGSTMEPRIGQAIQNARKQSPVRVEAVPITSSRGWSDQAAFVRAGVPTLFFYGYCTAAYHTRLDTSEHINTTGGAATVRLIYAVARGIEGLAAPATGPAPN